jgi:deazaflavin-dependent oxidoreductase (nitroreductase family)
MHAWAEISKAAMDEDLADWGKVIVLETNGRRTGRRRRATVGFVAEPDGSLVVAASTPGTQWALNLLADERCIVEREGARLSCRARPLSETERTAAVAALILKYGTPAERLGLGPAFRLVHSQPVVQASER